jgi:hypothetical protein
MVDVEVNLRSWAQKSKLWKQRLKGKAVGTGAATMKKEEEEKGEVGTWSSNTVAQAEDERFDKALVELGDGLGHDFRKKEEESKEEKKVMVVKKEEEEKKKKMSLSTFTAVVETGGSGAGVPSYFQEISGAFPVLGCGALKRSMQKDCDHPVRYKDGVLLTRCGDCGARLMSPDDELQLISDVMFCPHCNSTSHKYHPIEKRWSCLGCKKIIQMQGYAAACTEVECTGPPNIDSTSRDGTTKCRKCGTPLDVALRFADDYESEARGEALSRAREEFNERVEDERKRGIDFSDRKAIETKRMWDDSEDLENFGRSFFIEQTRDEKGEVVDTELIIDTRNSRSLAPEGVSARVKRVTELVEHIAGLLEVTDSSVLRTAIQIAVKHVTEHTAARLKAREKRRDRLIAAPTSTSSAEDALEKKRNPSAPIGQVASASVIVAALWWGIGLRAKDARGVVIPRECRLPRTSFFKVLRDLYLGSTNATAEMITAFVRRYYLKFRLTDQEQTNMTALNQGVIAMIQVVQFTDPPPDVLAAIKARKEMKLITMKKEEKKKKIKEEGEEEEEVKIKKEEGKGEEKKGRRRKRVETKEGDKLNLQWVRYMIALSNTVERITVKHWVQWMDPDIVRAIEYNSQRDEKGKPRKITPLNDLGLSNRSSPTIAVAQLYACVKATRQPPCHRTAPNKKAKTRKPAKKRDAATVQICQHQVANDTQVSLVSFAAALRELTRIFDLLFNGNYSALVR